MEVLAGDDVGGGHRPGAGTSTLLLLEDELALPVLDDGGVALFPGELVEGRDAELGEVAFEAQTRRASLLFRSGGGGGGVYNFPRILEELRTYQPNTLVFADVGLFE